MNKLAFFLQMQQQSDIWCQCLAIATDSMIIVGKDGAPI